MVQYRLNFLVRICFPDRHAEQFYSYSDVPLLEQCRTSFVLKMHLVWFLFHCDTYVCLTRRGSTQLNEISS